MVVLETKVNISPDAERFLQVFEVTGRSILLLDEVAAALKSVLTVEVPPYYLGHFQYPVLGIHNHPIILARNNGKITAYLARDAYELISLVNLLKKMDGALVIKNGTLPPSGEAFFEEVLHNVSRELKKMFSKEVFNLANLKALESEIAISYRNITGIIYGKRRTKFVKLPATARKFDKLPLHVTRLLSVPRAEGVVVEGYPATTVWGEKVFFVTGIAGDTNYSNDVTEIFRRLSTALYGRPVFNSVTVGLTHHLIALGTKNKVASLNVLARALNQLTKFNETVVKMYNKIN